MAMQQLSASGLRCDLACANCFAYSYRTATCYYCFQCCEINNKCNLYLEGLTGTRFLYLT